MENSAKVYKNAEKHIVKLTIKEAMDIYNQHEKVDDNKENWEIWGDFYAYVQGYFRR